MRDWPFDPLQPFCADLIVAGLSLSPVMELQFPAPERPDQKEKPR